MSDVQWEVRSVAMRSEITSIPPGWEPSAVGEVAIWIRRRVISEFTRPIPRGVLSAEEQTARRRDLEDRQAKEFIR